MLQVVGPNSVGTWDITFTKDGVPVNAYDGLVIQPPGGWAVTGGSTDKGAKTLKAVGVATNRDNGMVCSATISHIF